MYIQRRNNPPATEVARPIQRYSTDSVRLREPQLLERPSSSTVSSVDGGQQASPWRAVSALTGGLSVQERPSCSAVGPAGRRLLGHPLFLFVVRLFQLVLSLCLFICASPSSSDAHPLHHTPLLLPRFEPESLPLSKLISFQRTCRSSDSTCVRRRLS